MIGAPFYVMEWVDGHVLTEAMPAGLVGEAEAIAERAGRRPGRAARGRRRGRRAWPGFGRPDGYLARQLKRFGGL